jgi:hypothetical protein
MANFPVGTKVKAKRALPPLRTEIGDIGFVYANYDYGTYSGASIIFERGGYEGFSEEEQEQFLENLGVDVRYEDYKFTGVVGMYSDYLFGYWKFREPESGE